MSDALTRPATMWCNHGKRIVHIGQCRDCARDLVERTLDGIPEAQGAIAQARAQERAACLRYVSRAIEQANARKRAMPALMALEAMLKLGTSCEEIAIGPKGDSE